MKNAQWFQTKKAAAEFKKCTSLEDRAIFISEYLKCIINEYRQKQGPYKQFNDFEMSRINKVSFGFAIFLADAIYGSDLPYATYPALIDEKQNPFFSTWVGYRYGAEKNYYKSIFEAFTSIIEEENNRRRNDKTTFKQELIDEVGTATAQEYSAQIFSVLPDTDIYDLVPSLQAIQLKNMWFFERI